MRVLHIAYTHFAGDSRVQRYVQILAEKGHEVDVVALGRAGETVKRKIPGGTLWQIQERNSRERNPFAYFLRTAQFCLRGAKVLSGGREYDIAHVHNLPDYLVFATWRARRAGTPVILDIHDLAPELYAARFSRVGRGVAVKGLSYVESICVSFADHVIVANHLWRDRLIGRGLCPEKCTPLLNYPDLEVFRPRNGSRSKEISPGFVIFYPGSFNAHQGLDVALKAFALAIDKMRDAKLLLVGEGPEEVRLRRLVRSLGLEENVEIRGPRPLDEVARMMRDADLGLIPKLAVGFGGEAFSTKSLEFMASGVPVVMSRTPVDEYYFTDDLVRFFPSGDPRALAEVLVDEYRNRDAARERAARALEFARRESWQNRRQIYLDLVSRLTGKPV